MSNEFIVLLICLGVGILVCAGLLLKIIIEVRKTRKEFSEIQKEHIKEFQKAFMEKHSKGDTEA